MTGSDFYAYCLRTFKRTDKETEFYEALTDVVMDTKLRYHFEDFKEEAYTAAIDTLGEYKIALPSDFSYLIGDVVLVDDDGNEHQLIKLEKTAFDHIYPNPNSTNVIKGLPKHYCIYSGQILLGQVPDSISYNYQINYSTEAATTMASDTTSVPFTARFRWIMRDLVIAALYYGMSMVDEGDRFKKRGEDGIAQMIARDEWNTDAVSNQDYKDI